MALRGTFPTLVDPVVRKPEDLLSFRRPGVELRHVFLDPYGKEAEE
jgi:hypothetical protein